MSTVETKPAARTKADPKYLKTMRAADGSPDTVLVDVYAVLDAFGVSCPGRQHAIKKLLCAGSRGSKSGLQDLVECRSALERAIDLESQRTGEQAAPHPAACCLPLGEVTVKLEPSNFGAEFGEFWEAFKAFAAKCGVEDVIDTMPARGVLAVVESYVDQLREPKPPAPVEDTAQEIPCPICGKSFLMPEEAWKCAVQMKCPHCAASIHIAPAPSAAMMIAGTNIRAGNSSISSNSSDQPPIANSPGSSDSSNDSPAAGRMRYRLGRVTSRGPQDCIVDNRTNGVVWALDNPETPQRVLDLMNRAEAQQAEIARQKEWSDKAYFVVRKEPDGTFSSSIATSLISDLPILQKTAFVNRLANANETVINAIPEAGVRVAERNKDHQAMQAVRKHKIELRVKGATFRAWNLHYGPIDADDPTRAILAVSRQLEPESEPDATELQPGETDRAKTILRACDIVARGRGDAKPPTSKAVQAINAAISEIHNASVILGTDGYRETQGRLVAAANGLREILQPNSAATAPSETGAA